MSKHEGPKLRIDASCFDCTHEHSERYRVQGDSGSYVSCNHPINPGKHIGDTSWTTPMWCPLLPMAIEKLLAAPQPSEKGTGEK